MDPKSKSRRKLDTTVELNPILDLAPFMTEEAKVQGGEYELFSVICHSGSANGGHYISRIRNLPKNDWYEFNDRRVTRMSQDKVYTLYRGSEVPYFLFYRKVGLSQPSFQIPQYMKQMINVNSDKILYDENSEEPWQEFDIRTEDDEDSIIIKAYYFTPNSSFNKLYLTRQLGAFKIGFKQDFYSIRNRIFETRGDIIKPLAGYQLMMSRTNRYHIGNILHDTDTPHMLVDKLQMSNMKTRGLQYVCLYQIPDGISFGPGQVMVEARRYAEPDYPALYLSIDQESFVSALLNQLEEYSKIPRTQQLIFRYRNAFHVDEVYLQKEEIWIRPINEVFPVTDYPFELKKDGTVLMQLVFRIKRTNQPFDRRKNEAPEGLLSFLLGCCYNRDKRQAYAK